MSLASNKRRRVARREARAMEQLERRAWSQVVIARRTGESYRSLMRRMIDGMNLAGEYRLRRAGVRVGEPLMKATR